MTPAAARNDLELAQRDAALLRLALKELQSQVRKWLESLPQEVAEDVKELFELASKAESEQEKKEIGETIFELIWPDSLVVKIEEEFKLDHEDTAVRKRLQEYRERVGREIKKERLKQRLSQANLADKAGILQSHVSRLETGKHVPTHYTIERIAEALGVSPSSLDPGFDSDV